MVLRAGEPHAKLPLTGDRVDHADGVALVVEDTTLLDMQLDEGVDVVAPRTRERRRVEAAGPHRRADRRTVRVAQAIDLLGGHLPGEGARAPEVGREAAALLFAEDAHFERRSWRPIGVAQGRDGADGGVDAQRAIVLAALLHGIDVGAAEHRPCARGTGQAAEQVAYRILAR